MTQAYEATPAQSPITRKPIGLYVICGLILWFGLAFAFAASGGLAISAANGAPLGFAVAILVPIAVFAILYRAFGAFRDFILGLDPVKVNLTQLWRVVGFAFLALYAYGELPGFFAWPAGLGDVAVGIAALWIVAALVRNPAFAASRRFVTFHLLGLLDFVVAVGTGVVSSDAFGLFEVTTQPMSELPLGLIPGFAVPLFILLHFTALLQARALAKQEKPGHGS